MNFIHAIVVNPCAKWYIGKKGGNSGKKAAKKGKWSDWRCQKVSFRVYWRNRIVIKFVEMVSIQTAKAHVFKNK